MKQVKIKYKNVASLLLELTGTDPMTGEVLMTGLLKQKMSMRSKVMLTKLVEATSKEWETFVKVKNEKITEYGTADENGNYSISPFIGEGESATMNPQFEEFRKEFTELLEEEISIGLPPIKLSDFDSIVTEEVYAEFYKLFD